MNETYNKNISYNFKKCHSDKYSFLSYACELGNVGVVEALLSHRDTDPNYFEKIYGSYPPLIQACMHGRKECVERLCNHSNTDVNIRDIFGQTPLHHCVSSYNDMKLAEKIWYDQSIFCDINTILAELNNNLIDCVKILLRNNADTNIRDNNGKTPITMNNCPLILKDLITLN